jgi:hypothetical protein
VPVPSSQGSVLRINGFSVRVRVMPSLIEIQFDVLLARDTHGRLTATRDPVAQPAPRIFLGRSDEANVWGVRGDIDLATMSELDRLFRAEPKIEAARVGHRPECRELVLELLPPIDSEWRGPAYVLPDELPQDTRARTVKAEEHALWYDAFPWLAEQFEALSPVAIAFEAGHAAAVCHSPRGCTAHGVEAGVETLEPFRDLGLATAAVACWARAVQRTGRFALYSTSWENQASLAIARRLSARLYGEDWHIT